MTSGLLINPRAGKGNKKGLDLAMMLLGATGVEVRLLESFADVSASLESFARRGVTDIFISSGDGTIQEVQTVLAERNYFPQLPRLCLLPHGTTNMTAADIGFRERDATKQAEFIKHVNAVDIARRPTVRVANPRDGRPRHGMFLGTGAVAQASQFCQDAVHKSGLKGDLATFATLSASVLRAMATRAAPGDPTRIDRPHAIEATADGTPRVEGDQLLLLLTTLEKLVLGTKPFWGGKTEPLRVTSFPYPLPNLARWLIPSMFGGENRKPPPGAVSFSCRSCQIKTTSTFIIDGEFFEPPLDEPLRVETGPEFTYIRG